MQRAVNLFRFDEADLQSPFVQKVWRTYSAPADEFISVAKTYCEIVFTRMPDETWVTMRGPETRSSLSGIPQEAEFLAIRFTAGTFLPPFPTTRLVDAPEWLPVFRGTSFWLDDAKWEIPTLENVDVFVKKLVRKGLLQRDPILDALRDGRTIDLSLRSTQRRVLRSTGLTFGAHRQIERAEQAASLLDRGVPILDVVEMTGYADQPHLTRSLRRFMGQTPAQILREHR